MQTLRQMISAIVIREGLRYMEKDPIGNYSRLVTWAEKLAVKPDHKEMAKTFREIGEGDNNWFQLYTRVVQDVAPHIQRKFLANFFVNSAIAGLPAKEKIAKKNGRCV